MLSPVQGRSRVLDQLCDFFATASTSTQHIALGTKSQIATRFCGMLVVAGIRPVDAEKCFSFTAGM